MRASFPLSVVFGVVASLLEACGGERWVIGVPLEPPADAGPEPDAAAPRCGPNASEGIPAAASAPLLGAGHAGRWVAQLAGEEAEKFPSNQLQLTLGPEAARLRFEAGSPLPPVLDARAGYLCRAPGASTCTSASGFVAGFDYRLWGVAARGSILSFEMFLDEPWNEWCALQTPIEQRIPGCAPFYDVEPAYAETIWEAPCAVRRGDDWFEIDCDRLATLERRACVCSAAGCSATARLQQVHLRLIAPDALDGALWFAADHAQVLHFERLELVAAP